MKEENAQGDIFQHSFVLHPPIYSMCHIEVSNFTNIKLLESFLVLKLAAVVFLASSKDRRKYHKGQKYH